LETRIQLDALKHFFVQKFATDAGGFPHSVLNKLSTALALFVLQSMPDIWPTPLSDLFAQWGANQPELLLRFFRGLKNLIILKYSTKIIGKFKFNF
jgi:hypothetical protein